MPKGQIEEGAGEGTFLAFAFLVALGGFFKVWSEALQNQTLVILVLKCRFLGLDLALLN